MNTRKRLEGRTHEWLRRGALLVFTACVAAGCNKGSTEADSAGGSERAASVFAGACAGQDTPGSTTCTGTSEYAACVQDKCGSAFSQCLGSGYKSGSYVGGRCETYAQCITAAKDPCNSGCTATDGACQTCLTVDLATCILNSGCTPPACNG